MTGMAEEPIHADSSHYEISLTAGQAFMAVLLILGSIVAAFAFGAVVGTARGEERMSVRPSEPVSSILESEGSTAGHVDAPAEPERDSARAPAPSIIESEDAKTSPRPTVRSLPTGGRTPAQTSDDEPAPDRASSPRPHDAQLLSTSEKAPAEALAAKLIEEGFSSAYVARVTRDDSTLYRVRVRFDDEKAARDALPRLEKLAPGDVWILPVD